jgi:hypothetical protein
VTRLGSFRADRDDLLSGSARVIYVFDDALGELRPSRYSLLPIGLIRPLRNVDLASRSVENRANAIAYTSTDTSSEEIAGQFKGFKRTALADIRGVELQHGGKIATACTLTIRTANSTERFMVQADEAPQAARLLTRVLGSRFQSNLSS